MLVGRNPMGAGPAPRFNPPEGRCTCGQTLRKRRRDVGVGQSVEDLVQDQERLLDLPGANHEPCSDVPAVFDGNLKPQTLIAIVRVVSPEVSIHSRCTRGHPDDPEIARGLVREDSGSVHAVGERAGVDEQRDEVVEFLFE